MNTLLCFFSLIILCYVAQGEQQSVTTINCDVTIIGGGAGGANSAMLIKRKFPNASVCLLEKTSALGGHCSTRYFTTPAPGFLETGVVTIINTSKTNALGFSNFATSTSEYLQYVLQGTGATLIPTDFTGALGVNKIVDIAQQTAFMDAPPTDPAAFGAALQDFLTYTRSSFPWLSSTVYPSTIPPELRLNFKQWLLAIKPQYLPLIPLFSSLLTISGMGSWDQLDAFHAIQAMDPAVSSLFLPFQTGMAVSTGCSTIYTAIAAKLGAGSVFYNVQVNDIDRPSNSDSNKKIEVDAQIGNVAYRFKSKYLFIGVAPTYANLKKMGYDFKNLRELLLFSKVKTRYYFTSVIDNAGPGIVGKNYGITNVNTDQGTFPDLTLGQPAHPAIVACFRIALPYGPASCKAVSDEIISEQDMTNLVYIPQLNSINNAGPFNPGNVSLTLQTNPVILHEFHPHFPVNLFTFGLTTNAYKRVEALQGDRNTYFVGALMTFSNHARIIDHAASIVNTLDL